MNIKIKRRSNRANEFIAVIEFKDKKDADSFFAGMEAYLDFEYMPRAVRDIISKNLEKIKERCDDKYAHDGCELSACLFSDEFEMLSLAFLISASNKYYDTVLVKTSEDVDKNED